MDNKILSTFLKDTYTLSQLKHRLKILRIKLSQQFFGGQSEDTLSPLDLKWFDSIPKELLSLFNKDNYSRLISDMELSLSKLQMLTVYLPFEANDDALKDIGTKSRQLFGEQFLLDIKYNPELIAGCALSWKGIYKDYSLHARIEERKQVIGESFKKFIR